MCVLAGCMDSQACNYEEGAVVDDGSCSYGLDCMGVCGGDAVEDVCGICDGTVVDEEDCSAFFCNMEFFF